MGNSGEKWGTEPPPFELTQLQFKAIELALQGMRDTQIARELSIDRKTLWNWKTHDPEFIRALDDARGHMFGEVADRYRTLLMSATAVMAKFLTDQADNNRFRAAYALLMMARCFRPPPKMELPPDADFPLPELPPKVG